MPVCTRGAPWYFQDAQGFLLSRPLQADAARELLRRVGELGDASRTQRLRIITG